MRKAIAMMMVVVLVGLMVLAVPGTRAQAQGQYTYGYATVTAYYLNVRSGPGTGSPVIARISRGEAYPVVGRNVNATWFQIVIGGTYGWASGAYLSVGDPYGVPVTDGGIVPPPQEVRGTVTAYYLNVRTGPGAAYPSISTVSMGSVYTVTGRNADNSWFRIMLNASQMGWVSSAYLSVTNPYGVAVIEVGPVPAPVQTWTLTDNVNVRSGPSVWYAIAGWLYAGTTVTAVGRDASGTWVQIQTNIGPGWITTQVLPYYANVSALPITG